VSSASVLLILYISLQVAPESKGTLILVLLADMMNAVTREAILIQDNVTNNLRGNLQVGSIAVIGVLFFVILSSINLLYIWSKHSSRTRKMKVALWAVHMVGAILFYYGDNITYLADNYGKSLDWSEQVIENHRNAATISVGLALVFFCFAPACLRKVANKYDIYIVDSAPYSAFDMITTIATLEALYTLVVRTPPTESCDKTVSISFIVLCSIAGTVLIVTYCAMYNKSDTDDRPTVKHVKRTLFFLLLIALPLHLLADSPLPLDCVSGHNVLRLCFSVFGLLFASIATAALFWLNCTTTVEG
jgi:hypothetical protein